MGDARIIHIELDEATILWRNADIEQERRIAIFDLIEENTFKPVRAWDAGHQGPYRLRLSVEDGRLALAIAALRARAAGTQLHAQSPIRSSLGEIGRAHV